MERELILLEARDGYLHRDLADYLATRTGGYLGSLAHLLRGGALAAIRSGGESLDEHLLDKIPLDVAAESRRRRASSQP
jgi:hypothetical protein